MTTQALHPATHEPAAWPLGRAALVAALGSAIANAALFEVAAARGVFPPGPLFPTGPGQAMTLGPVVLVSVVAALAGAGVFALLRSRTPRPMRTFTIAAAVVTVLSFAAPLAMPDWTGAQATALDLMHVVAAGIVVWAMSRTEPRRG